MLLKIEDHKRLVCGFLIFFAYLLTILAAVVQYQAHSEERWYVTYQEREVALDVNEEM